MISDVVDDCDSVFWCEDCWADEVWVVGYEVVEGVTGAAGLRAWVEGSG